MTTRQKFFAIALITVVAVAILTVFWNLSYWVWLPLGLLLGLGFYDAFQTKHAIKRNFPIIGNLRYLFEEIRPEIMQYFVETDTEGRPINRLRRSLIYQRAKKVNDTTPFGTQLHVYDPGYEWIDHSLFAIDHHKLDTEPRVMVGGAECKQPYSASILNISAMSFGSLSKNAVLAMNLGARLGHFAQNTGEGGVSPYHREHGGDLIWQIGTGYFGCRTGDGAFSEEEFSKTAQLDCVKMIELKLSQGAKPGHGGILPAVKNTPEIAGIRLVEPHTTVYSPACHTAFDDSEGLLKFVARLRELSGYKPVGFKLCIGKKEEFEDICEAMVKTGIKPDFISVDGGEGGTGAAPVEFSNSLGMPMRDGLALAVDMLNSYGLKKDIRIIASGKIIQGFDIARAMALGADMVSNARAIMIAAGCIQALQCNNNSCPVGVATQDKSLMKGLVVKDKAERVASYHQETVKSFVELMAAAGITQPSDLKREHINKRISISKTLKYSEIYPES